MSSLRLLSAVVVRGQGRWPSPDLPWLMKAKVAFLTGQVFVEDMLMLELQVKLMGPKRGRLSFRGEKGKLLLRLGFASVTTHLRNYPF